jgi:hypothetical protein
MAEQDRNPDPPRDDAFERAREIMKKLAETPHKPHEPIGKKRGSDERSK